MESRYKEILLLVGLDNITDEELQRFKFFLPDEFTVAKGKLEAANRTELANLLIQNQGVKSAVTKTIAIFRKLNYMHVAASLEEEKEKVDNEYMRNAKKKGSKLIKKKSQAQVCLVASATSRSDATKQGAAPEISPQTQPKEKPLVAQQEPLREGLQKEALTVLVLKAMQPFEFETQEGKQRMFHATVATETDFFFVKVFDTRLKDKFVRWKIITISQYYGHSDFLEVTRSSIVLDANSDQKVSVPQNIIRKAGETPKINKLQTQPLGTIVNGVFMVQKKTERKEGVLFDLHDSTGSMKALVLGNQSEIQCAKGDKLRLTFFEVSKSGKNLQLNSGVHSFIKVIKARKPKMKRTN